MSHAGTVVRLRRIALGLTQEEVVTRLGNGVRQADISIFEHTGMGLPEWDRLAQVLHLSPDDVRAHVNAPRSNGSTDTAIPASAPSQAAAPADSSLEGVLQHARQMVTMLEQLMQSAQGATDGVLTDGETKDGASDRGDASCSHQA